MSLHWTLIAGFLYLEIGVVLLLMLPFISSRTWHAFFKSRFFRGLQSQLITLFYIIAAILLLFFLDAVREAWKYNAIEHKEGATYLDAQIQNHLRLFRAQRNMYISGFAGFLCLIISRLVDLISNNATLQAEKEAALKQAESASKAAESLLTSDDTTREKSANIKELEASVAELKEKLTAAHKNVESMKSQAESVGQEYDMLMEEKDRLQRKVNIMGDKKDE
jgi:B-cell receptor-associated protein 31